MCVAAVAGTGTTARTTTDLSPHMQLSERESKRAFRSHDKVMQIGPG